MDDNDIELPDIESSIPEPDFFESGTEPEDVAARVSTSFAELPSIEMDLGQPADILDSFRLGDVVTDSKLKYDDETCAFNEFLIINSAATKSDTAAKEKEMEACSQNESPSKDKDGTNDTGGVDSEPATPDSRSASSITAVYRLDLPKVSIRSKKRISISRESPNRVISSTQNDEKTVSPPRQTRGRLNVPPMESTKKRKLVDEDDEDYITSGDDTENTIVNKVSTTRSGRHTRKVARYTDNSDVEDDNNKRNSKSHKRTTNENNNQYSAKKSKKFEDELYNLETCEKTYNLDDSADSDVFVPVKVSGHKNYIIEEAGTIHFTNTEGEVTVIRSSHIPLKRMSPDDVREVQDKYVRQAASRAVLLEVCIDNFLSAKEAVKGGARRIELCSSLVEGGLTPSSGFLTLVKRHFPDIPVFVMIRPRGGDFQYTPDELEIMSMDITQLKKSGADGFVFGVLTDEGEVDEVACRKLVGLAHPLDCTFHRAFDKVSDPIVALNTVINLGFKRILTSGLSATASQGIPTLKRIVEAAGDQIIIMPGAGITDKNVADIIRKTGVKEVHGSASKSVHSITNTTAPVRTSQAKGKGKNKRGSKGTGVVKMGHTDESFIKITDSILVAQIVKASSRR